MLIELKKIIKWNQTKLKPFTRHKISKSRGVLNFHFGMSVQPENRGLENGLPLNLGSKELILSNLRLLELKFYQILGLRTDFPPTLRL